MTIWQDFEIKCTNYLNEKFGEYAKFIHLGESDSTVPDIKVICNNKDFYIEAKHSPAQCGQFVLLPNLKTLKFDYSKLNIASINKYSGKIIEYMNENFEEFKEAGTAGKNINFENSSIIFANWIVNFYKDKKVKYFITNNYTLVPLENFLDYFNVNAKYRVKRSGSSSVGKSNLEIIKSYINTNYNITKIEVEMDKVFVVSPTQLHNKRFIINGIEYMFSIRDNRYEIRRLSNTFNANVIFSIELKPNKQGLSFNDFILYLISD